ncbi:PHP domain-containing protein [Eionea flava]
MYDLHTHSYCSDGTLSPTELVRTAHANGVRVLALTDHDTLEGIAEASEAASNKLLDDMTIITGIELSTQWRGRGIHIVGLNVDIDSPELQQAVERQTQVRIKRAQTIADKLEKSGIKGALDGARHYAGQGAIGRPHFAQYMVDAGYVGSIPQAFKRYLGAGKVGDVKQCWPDIDEAVQWISAAGGIAVLAHPDKYDLTRTKLYELLGDFVEAGGQAMEVVSGHQDKTVTQKLARAANDFSLLASCGSDFHSPNNTWQSLGGYSALPDDVAPVWTQFTS